MDSLLKSDSGTSTTFSTLMHPSVICFCPATGFLPFAELPPFFFCCPLFFFEPPPPDPPPCLYGGLSQWSFVLWLFFPHFAQCFSYFFVIKNLFIVDDDLEALAFRAFLLDSSWITQSMISCNLYFVILSMLLRYWRAVSWYESGRVEQNMKTTTVHDTLFRGLCPDLGFDQKCFS